MVNPCDAKNYADEVLRLLKSTVEICFFNLVLLRGTCLGFYRGGDFIENDNDIDIGILSDHQECSSEEKLFVKEKLLETGFRCPILGDIAGQEHWWAPSQPILICIRWTFNFPKTPGFSHLHFMQSFDKVVYRKEPYNVPHPVEDYLAYCYSRSAHGKDWKIPRLRSKPKSP